MAETWWHTIRNFVYRTQETGVAGGGKMATETGAGALSASSHAGYGVGSAFSGVGGVVLVGGFAAVSAVVNQLEYMHERQDMAEFYQEELASKLKKSAKKVSGSDLDVLEKGSPTLAVEANQTIKEHSFKQRWVRNIGIGASMIASVAAFVLIHSIADQVGAGAAAGEAAHIATEGAKTATIFTVGFLAKGVATLLAYMALKAPLAAAGNMLMGVNKETTHDKIVGIAKDRAAGKSISREQVVGVFVSASAPLAEFVESHFGKGYDKLALADKVHVAEQLSNFLPLDEIAKNINLGVTNAAELAFTVDGQVSGVAPKLPERTEKPSMLEAFTHKCKHMVHHITKAFKREKPAQMQGAPATHAKPKHDYFAQMENDETPASNFVERMGLQRKDEKTSYSERIAQAREAQMLAPASNTVH